MDLQNFKHAFGQNAFHFVWKPKYAWDVFKFYGIRCDCERFIREADRYTERYSQVRKRQLERLKLEEELKKGQEER